MIKNIIRWIRISKPTGYFYNNLGQLCIKNREIAAPTGFFDNHQISKCFGKKLSLNILLSRKEFPDYTFKLTKEDSEGFFLGKGKSYYTTTVCKIDYHFRYCNRGVRSIFGFPPKEIYIKLLD